MRLKGAMGLGYIIVKPLGSFASFFRLVPLHNDGMRVLTKRAADTAVKSNCDTMTFAHEFFFNKNSTRT